MSATKQPQRPSLLATLALVVVEGAVPVVAQHACELAREWWQRRSTPARPRPKR